MQSTQQPPPQVGLARVREVASFLGVCRTQVYRLMERGELPYAKLGKSRRIPWEAVHRLVERSIVGELADK